MTAGARATPLVGSALILLLAAACGGGDTAPPAPGPVLVRLEGVAAADEALLLDIAAGATAVQRARDDVEVHARASAGTSSFSVAVFGPLAGGPFLRVIVSDPQSPPAFTLREVAASDGTLRTDLGSYRLHVERAP